MCRMSIICWHMITRPLRTSLGLHFISSLAHSNALSHCRQPPTRINKLTNGIRVASQRTFDEIFTIGVWIDSGSRYETKATNGCAHFLEHLIFKGTKKRNRVQLEQEIENMGAHLNAYTAREQTAYYATAPAESMDHVVELLSDILTNSEIKESAIENEKHVILREMEEVNKVTEEIIFDRLHTAAFRDCSLGCTILGSEENIRNMKRQYLIDYINRNYTAERMVVAAAGNIDHKKFFNVVEKYFSKIKPAKYNALKPPEVKPYFCGSELLYRDDNIGSIAHVAVAFEGVSWTSPDAITFMLMQSIIGSYKKNEEGLVPGKISANRTINNIANKMNTGCAEMFSAFNTCYSDTGLFGFYAQADEVAVEHCMGELMFSIASLSYSVTDEEVQRGKLQLKTQFLGSLETTTAIAEDIGRQLLVYGRRISIVEFLKRLDAIDAEEVKRVAWKYLHDTDIAVTALGPLHGMPQYMDLRRQTFWFRY